MNETPASDNHTPPPRPPREAIEACMSQYITFTGRASRSEYWWFYLFTLLLGGASLITATVSFVYFDDIESALSLMAFFAFLILELPSSVYLALLIPNLAAGTRRLHDIGRSGWWQLLYLTLIGIPVLIYWFSQPGKSARNEYDQEHTNQNTNTPNLSVTLKNPETSEFTHVRVGWSWLSFFFPLAPVYWHARHGDIITTKKMDGLDPKGRQVTAMLCIVLVPVAVYVLGYSPADKLCDGDFFIFKSICRILYSLGMTHEMAHDLLYVILAFGVLWFQIWCGVNNNKLIARNYIWSGWQFSEPDSEAVIFATKKWKADEWVLGGGN